MDHWPDEAGNMGYRPHRAAEDIILVRGYEHANHLSHARLGGGARCSAVIDVEFSIMMGTRTSDFYTIRVSELKRLSKLKCEKHGKFRS